MQPPNIVVIGHVCIDHNKSEHATYIGWGSPAIYMADYCQRHHLGAVTISASYGTDLQAFLPQGVTIVPSVPNRPQTLVYENDTSGSKRVQHCYNTEVAVPPEVTEELQRVLAKADIVVMAPLLPDYNAVYINTLLTYVPKYSVKVLCPQGYFRHVAEDGLVSPQDFHDANNIVPLFDITMYSKEDYPGASELAHSWAQAYGRAVIVTESERGATLFTGDGAQHVPTTPIPGEDIVDSVGCGDVFAVAVSLAYWQTRNLVKSVKAAHAAAALKLRSAPAGTLQG